MARHWNELEEKVPKSPEIIKEMQHIVEAEKKHLNPSTLICRGDVGLFELFWYRPGAESEYGSLLRILYWRGRIQVACLGVFSVLVARGLITLECFLHPIAFHDTTDQVNVLVSILDCFSGIFLSAPRRKYSEDSSEPLYWYPVQWLAIVIIRGGIESMQRILDEIKQSRFFGEFDELMYEKKLAFARECKGAPALLRKTPNICPCEAKMGGSWGFWLPSRLETRLLSDVVTAIREGREHFNRVEKCYRDCFGVKAEDIIPEEKAVFFMEHPESEPGYDFSGPPSP
ncbi:MAG: hypothetical protein M1829_005453 [Trizodia sp. TS-e1964]|nr:MAG: hypothetical protein M1829_005453 [Trizodia sp. TS-e1964]